MKRAGNRNLVGGLQDVDEGEDVPSYWLVDSLWSVRAPAESTGGALTVLDQVMPRRSGPPPHVWGPTAAQMFSAAVAAIVSDRHQHA